MNDDQSINPEHPQAQAVKNAVDALNIAIAEVRNSGCDVAFQQTSNSQYLKTMGDITLRWEHDGPFPMLVVAWEHDGPFPM